MDDLASILLTDEPTAQEKLAALTAHLRRQQAVGQLASLIGGPAKGFGQTLTSGADQELAQAAQVPMERQRLALQRQQLASGEADAAQKATERGYQNAPGSAMSGAARALLSKFMPKQPVAPNASASELLGVLPLAEKAYGVDENARQRALARSMMAGKDAAAVGGYSEEAINALADQWAATGKAPAMGMGKAAVELRGRIADAMMKRHPGADLAQAGAGYGADTASLKKLQQSSDAVEAFEATATANLDRALSTAKGVIDVGSPWFNKPLRAVEAGLAGDPKLAAYQTARQVAANEVAKVLSGSMGNQALSDSARHEASALLDPNASLAQLEAAANVLKADMASRKTAFRQQLGEVRGRTGGGSNPPAAGAIPSTSGDVGFTPEKKKRLEELRAKRAAGTIQ